MNLTKEQVESLREWAREGYRQNGCTAWGPKFNAAMSVARQILASEESEFGALARSESEPGQEVTLFDRCVESSLPTSRERQWRLWWSRLDSRQRQATLTKMTDEEKKLCGVET